MPQPPARFASRHALARFALNLAQDTVRQIELPAERIRARIAIACALVRLDPESARRHFDPLRRLVPRDSWKRIDTPGPWSTLPDSPEARRLANRRAALDQLYQAGALARVDWKRAEAAYQRAHRLDPSAGRDFHHGRYGPASGEAIEAFCLATARRDPIRAAWRFAGHREGFQDPEAVESRILGGLCRSAPASAQAFACALPRRDFPDLLRLLDEFLPPEKRLEPQLRRARDLAACEATLTCVTAYSAPLHRTLGLVEVARAAMERNQ